MHPSDRAGKVAEGGAPLGCGAGHRVRGARIVYCLPQPADAMKAIAALGSLRSPERAYLYTEGRGNRMGSAATFLADVLVAVITQLIETGSSSGS